MFGTTARAESLSLQVCDEFKGTSPTCESSASAMRYALKKRGWSACRILGDNVAAWFSKCDLCQLTTAGSHISQLKHMLATCLQTNTSNTQEEGQDKNSAEADPRFKELTEALAIWDEKLAAGLKEATKKLPEGALAPEECELQVEWNNVISDTRLLSRGGWPIVSRLAESSLEVVQEEFKGIDQKKVAEAFKALGTIVAKAQTLQADKLHAMFPSFPQPALPELESMLRAAKVLLGCQSGCLAAIQ